MRDPDPEEPETVPDDPDAWRDEAEDHDDLVEEKADHEGVPVVDAKNPYGVVYYGPEPISPKEVLEVVGQWLLATVIVVLLCLPFLLVMRH